MALLYLRHNPSCGKERVSQLHPNLRWNSNFI